MNMALKIAGVLAAAWLALAPAQAQQLPTSTLFGNPTGAQAPGRSVAIGTPLKFFTNTLSLNEDIGASGILGSAHIRTITGTIAKATATGNANLALLSNNAIAANPLAMSLQVLGNATGSLRVGEIQVSEYGLATYRTLSLQPSGGSVSVGLSSGTAPSALLDVRGTAQIANTAFLPFLPAPVWTTAFARIGNLYSSTYQQALAINQVVPLSADVYPAYEADALHVSTRTTDPSNVNAHDAVAIAAYGTIASTNSLGRVWAHFAQAAIEAGGDGTVNGLELSVKNLGSSQPLVSTATSKYNLDLTTEDNPTTAGIIFSPSGPGWHKGIYAEPASITGATGSQFIELLGKFTVAKTGFTNIAGTTLTAHPVGIQAEATSGFALGIQGRASDGVGVISFYSNNLGTLYASLSSNSASQLLSSSTFAPADDGLRNLGTATNAWLNTYTNNLILGGTTVQTGTVVFLATGQSNGVGTGGTYTWAPNFYLWNNNYTGSTGTAFTQVSAGANVNSFTVAANEYAWRHPTVKVYLINASYAGQASSHWVSGSAAPDMWAIITANVTPALAAAGVSTINGLLVWQGESDNAAPATWIANWTTIVNTQFKAQTWFPQATPILFNSISGTAVTGNANDDLLNNAIAAFVGVEPAARAYVYGANTATVPALDWSDTIHATATGYATIGRITAQRLESVGTAPINGPNNNVTDPPFNATCNGTTNDAVAIQAAITAAVSNKRPVAFPAGATCLSGALTTPGGVKFLGNGATLKAHASVAGTYLLINQNTGSYTDSDITIENLIIDGNNIGSGAGQPVRNGLIGMNRVTRLKFIRSKCFNYQYTCLEIPSSIDAEFLDSEFTSWGYATSPSVTGDAGPAIYNQSGGTTDHSTGSLFRGNYFHDGNWTAIYLDQEFIVDNNRFKSVQEAAVITPYVPASNELSKDAVISNNVIDTVTKHDISASCIETEARGLVIIGNVITNCGHDGILVSDSINNVIKGNRISNVNRQGDGAQGSGIVVRSVTGTPKNILIQGNRIWDDQGTVTSYACIGYIGTNPSTEQSVVANDCSNTVWVSGSSFLEYTANRFGANSILRDNLPTSINRPCLVTEGCTGLAIGTSGGIPYFSSTTAITSSALLTQFGPLYGGGAGGAPVAMAAGTDGQIIVGQTSFPPLWKTASGDLTVAASGAFTIANNAVTLAKMATQAANTVLANVTSGTAVPTAHAMTSCSTAASAVSYTTNTGFGCNTSITAAGVPVGGITGLGTGVATALAVNTEAAGSFVVNGNALGTPSSGTLTNATGLPTTGLSGTLQAAQEPAHTGDVTNSAGSLVLTIVNSAVSYAKIGNLGALAVMGRSANSSGVAADITGTADQVLRVAASAGSLGFGSIDLSKSAAVGTSVLAGANGGTGLSTAAVGDIIYASATTPTWSRLADVAAGSVLVSGGIGSAPSWSAAITVTTSVTTAALAGTTSTTTPLVIGGSGAGSSVEVRSTSGTGTSDFIKFTGGTNGGTEWGRFTAGQLGIGTGATAPVTWVEIKMSSNGGAPATSGTAQANGGLRLRGAFAGVLDFGTNGGSYQWIQSTDATSLASNYVLALNPNGAAVAVNGTSAVTTGDALAVNGQLSGNGKVYFTTLTADTLSADRSVCQDTTSKEIKTGTGTLGACLGTSSARFKTGLRPITDGLAEVMQLRPKNYFYKPGHGDDGAREQYGFTAEDLIDVLPRLTHLDAEGKPLSVDLVGMIPIIVQSIQELKAANDNLNDQLKRSVAR